MGQKYVMKTTDAQLNPNFLRAKTIKRYLYHIAKRIRIMNVQLLVLAMYYVYNKFLKGNWNLPYEFCGYFHFFCVVHTAVMTGNHTFQQKSITQNRKTLIRDCRQITFVMLNRFFPLSKPHTYPMQGGRPKCLIFTSFVKSP